MAKRKNIFIDAMRAKLTRFLPDEQAEAVMAKWNYKFARRFYAEFRCGAHARSTGQPCKARALENGRCRLHGGASTGPKTAEGRARIAEAQRRRWAARRLDSPVIAYLARMD
jgi:hypothetical protein